MKRLSTFLFLCGMVMRVHAQGMSYDMKTTADMPDPRTGVATSRVMSAGHGQFSGGNTRIDFTESMMPGGMMGAGSYMIVHNTSPVVTYVFPAKHEYLELDRNEISKDAAEAQKALGGIAKTEITGVVVDMKPLGAGETIEGNPTVKFRMTTDYTMNLTMMGHTTSSAQHSINDLWIAPGLDGQMNPMARQATNAGGPMASLTEAMKKAYAKLPNGLVLKAVVSTESEAGGKKRNNVMTMQVSNLKRASVDAAIFIVPTGYTKTEGLSGAMGAMFGDSIAAARARARTKRPD